MNKTNSAAFDARADALNSVLSAWLRSMKVRRGLQFRTVTNSGHAEIALKTSLPVIITASTTACDRLGGEADSLIQEMTAAMLERMAERFVPIETGHWLAADLAVQGLLTHAVIQCNESVICTVVALPGEVCNPPAAHGRGPADIPDGQSRFTGTGRRRFGGQR